MGTFTGPGVRWVCFAAGLLAAGAGFFSARAEALCAVKGRGGEIVYTNAPPSGRCTRPIVMDPAPAATPDAPAVRAWDAAVNRHAASWGVSKALVRAVIAQESGGNPNAVSRKGAQGLMQLMPATARRFSVEDPFDPEQNIAGGVQYLAELLDRFGGDVKLALAAYNAGEGAVERHNGIPPYKETRTYVKRVLERAGTKSSARRNTESADKTAARAAAEPIRTVVQADGTVSFEN